MTEKTVHIMLVDDHPLVRDGLRARLEAVSHFRVVAEADSGAEALALAGTTRIDLVLMDITMRDGSGIEATARLYANFPDIAVLILSMHDKLEYVTQAIQAGARGYVLKDAPGKDIVLAIEDDGAGFDLEHVAVHPQRGIGLRNMMERLDAIGGTLSIDSSAAGTTVCASVELED